MNIAMLAVMAVSVFLIGGLWYSKLLFGPRWCQYAGIDMEKNRGIRCGYLASVCCLRCWLLLVL